MSKEKINKQLSHYGYFENIMKIQNELMKDRLYQFLDDKNYTRLTNKLEEFWLELCKVDEENGYTLQGNINTDKKFGA